MLISDLDNDKYNRTNEIISLFSQYFFDYFNKFNKNTKVFWHAKCFSINHEKINSYIKFRSKIIKNVLTTYFLKKHGLHFGNRKMSEKELKCSEFLDYSILEQIQDGILYFNGEKIDLNEFYNGNIKIINNKKINDEAFINLFDFN